MSKLVELSSASICICPSHEVSGVGYGGVQIKRRVRDVTQAAHPDCSVHGVNRVGNFGSFKERVRSGWRPLKRTLS